MLPGWYSHYRGRSLGRVLAFVEQYCGLHVAEYVTVGEYKVSYYNSDTFASYEWDGCTDVPIFTFYGEEAGRYTDNQTELRDKIIEKMGGIFEVKPILGKWSIFDNGVLVPPSKYPDWVKKEHEFKDQNDAWLEVSTRHVH